MIRGILVAFALGCSDAEPPRMEPPPPIVFEEATDDRVPLVTQTVELSPQRDIGAIAGPGVAVGDVDGDGRPDLFLVGGGLFLNRPDARGFRLEAAPFPAVDFLAGAAAFGDFDRDGDLDLALAGYGTLRLYRNQGAAFTELRLAYPEKQVALTVAWGDLDGDGWLDLVTGNYGLVWDQMEDQQPPHLYLNNRDGSFRALPDPSARRAIVTAFADFDGDGKLDVFIGDDNQVAFLDRTVARHDLVLLNRGLDGANQPMLVESSAQLGLGAPHATMGLAFSSELFLSDVHAGWLYRQEGGIFSDVTKASGIDLTGPMDTMQTWYQWGALWNDLDGDGFEDLLVAQTNLFRVENLEVGPLLLHNRAGQFELERFAFGEPMAARALLPADLDLDGDVDIVVAPYFDRFRFFVNQTAQRRHVRVALEATESAPGAAGALVTAKSGGVTQTRRRVSGGQPSSQGEEVLDFAVAGATELTVNWPNGKVQTLSVMPPVMLTVTEP